MDYEKRSMRNQIEQHKELGIITPAQYKLLMMAFEQDNILLKCKRFDGQKQISFDWEIKFSGSVKNDL